MPHVILVALALLVAAARPAAACSDRVTTFEAFDQASIVVYARVRVPGGRFALAVIKTLKGTAPKQIDLGITGHRRSFCEPSRLRGTGVVFLTDTHGFAAGTQSFSDDKQVLAALTLYAKATTPAERAAVLVEQTLANERRAIRFHAVLTLAGDPVLLNAITPADRDRMLAALPSLETSYAAIVLARLGVAASKLGGSNSHATELATHRTFEAITKPADLADIIAAAPEGPDPRAIAAFERCERLRGKRLMRIAELLDGLETGLDWKKLADVCRRG